jgi:ATP-dependent DNA helicase RecQ
MLGTLQLADHLVGTTTSTHRGNSAQRVRALHDAFIVPPHLAAELPQLTGPVLLVDDLTDSGWTLSLAGRALRRAGAPGVLPLALAVAG